MVDFACGRQERSAVVFAVPYLESEANSYELEWVSEEYRSDACERIRDKFVM